MKKIVMAIFAGIVLLGVAQAQNQSSLPTQQVATNQTPQPGLPEIAPGSVIPVQLSKTIEAKKLKPGDEVYAKVTEDMKSESGQVIVPKDTTVIGHVTEAQTRSKQQKESDIAIAFDQAVMKSGANLHLPMSIQAIIAPPSSVPGGDDAGQQVSAPGGSIPGSLPTGGAPTENPSGANQHPPITGQTQGVVGYSNLSLAAAENGKNGSVISSMKSNVKLESGTLLLLRVS